MSNELNSLRSPFLRRSSCIIKLLGKDVNERLESKGNGEKKESKKINMITVWEETCKYCSIDRINGTIL